MNKWILLAIAIGITLIGRDLVRYSVALCIERRGLVALFVAVGRVWVTIEPALRWFRRGLRGA